MAFDQSTRNRLQKFVSDARGLLSEEFSRQLQNDYGLDPHSGTVTPVESLGHLDDTRRETARILRDTLAHYLASSPSGGVREALGRIVREQAFTVLNRLAALRMAESRGILIESVGNGYQSKGFQLYERLAGPGLGETGETYRCYLFSIFDEFALDLKVLFDRFSPQGRLFPRETSLLDLLKLLNDSELAHLWAEDESIGWVYQYFNSKEERKKMRDESAAPRNSRELAVRNQFFTPRYVVEFLTDNTLGRIWYEMTQGETSLKESCRYLVRRSNEFFLKAGEKAPGQTGGDETLSQEELLKQPVYVQSRLLKDPRTLRMLDPACGSMHFGLYAFDLYEQIYDEAWELELRLGSKAFVREGGLNPLIESYPDKEAFLKDVPRLIIEHNIHGIDIDPRATQIAGLSLWLRAQRSWHNQGVKPVDRPRITRSNIVCAEPMPGEKELLREFTASLEVPALGYLVEQVFDKMQLAGEAGSLLKIEEEIRGIIAEAKRLWKAGPKLTQMGLFGETPTKREQIDLPLDFSGITDERFWESAEEKLYQALQEYAEVAGEHGYQRRLFAEDASRGFAFIDLCRKRFEVAVMNPPFGASSLLSEKYIARNYQLSKNDIYGCFIDSALNRRTETGLIAAITSRTWMFLPRRQDIRLGVIDAKSFVHCLADLGLGVLDAAMVETCAFVLKPKEQTQKGTFVRLLDVGEDNKPSILLDAVCNSSNPRRFDVEQTRFKLLPGAPFAYWISNSLFELLANSSRLDDELEIGPGLTTRDNERFLRSPLEVPRDSISNHWFWFAKGGSFSPYYFDTELVLNYVADGREVKAWIASFGESVTTFIANQKFYFRSGFTYPRVTVKGFNVRVLRPGHIFAEKGISIFSKKLDTPPSIGLLAYLNSSLVQELLLLMAPSRSWEKTFVANLPLYKGSMLKLENYASQIISILTATYSSNPISNLFIRPKISSTLSVAVKNIELEQHKDSSTVRDYAKASSDIVRIELGALLPENDEFLNDVWEAAFTITTPFDYCTILLDYIFGCIYGRWDIRFTTGENSAPELPAPFASLPICPPGMLQNANSLPAEPQDVPAVYPLRISWSGILVDDEGYKEDIATRIREAIEVIWKENAGDIEHEACEMLEARSLRDYLCKANGFFADHLKRYSKSRREAPIYWPLSTSTGSYTLWIYYHRLNDQTLYTCVMDYVEPKLRDVAAELGNLRQKGSGRSRDDEKKLEKLQDLEMELQEFRDELLRLARLPWKPNLNDGVQITAAPLWKLFQLPKWKKTLKETWEKLEKGDYDWAHLAYSIWPDRVKKKCITDKSLAIAHGLEELYVEPPASAKKKLGKKAAVIDEEGE